MTRGDHIYEIDFINMVFLTLAQFLVLKWGVILLLFLLVGVKSFILSGPIPYPSGLARNPIST